MAATNIGRANLMITASATELNRTLDGVQNRLLQFGKQAAIGLAGGLGIGGGAGALFSTITGGNLSGAIAAATSAGKGLVQVFVDAAKAADDLHDDAAALGATPGGLFGLRAAALDNVEALDKGLLKLSREIGSAMTGNKEAVESFDKLGLSARELASVPLNEAFLRITDSINKLPTAAERSRAAFDLFGKSGQKNLELIGRARELSGFFEDLGSKLNALPTDRLADSFDKSQIAATGLNFAVKGLVNSSAALAFDSVVTQFAFGALTLSRLGGNLNLAAEAQKRLARETAAAADAQRDATVAFESDMAKRASKAEMAISFREVMEDNKAMLQLAKETQTPFEKWNAELERMGDLFERRVIDAELFRRGLLRMAGELEGASKTKLSSVSPFASVATIGSSEAADAFNREFTAQMQSGPEKEILSLLKDRLNLPTPELQERIRQGMRSLEKLEKKLEVGEGI